MLGLSLLISLALKKGAKKYNCSYNIIENKRQSGFMLCAMFLSMWISNTAATAMMVPIVDAIDKAINSDNNANDTEVKFEFIIF